LRLYLIDLVDAPEEGLAGVHLHEHAAEGPHVDGHGVWQAQHHLVVVGVWVGVGVCGDATSNQFKSQIKPNRAAGAGAMGQQPHV
jgi:hypothetical protein